MAILRTERERMHDEEMIAEDFVETDWRSASKELIAEVAGWKLEAKNEDNDRYFFHVRETSAIEGGDRCYVIGDRCYVIGRKGSGKTAISEYLGRIADHETFSEKLTFKNFPFNDLYRLSNDGFSRPNQYITLWKYVIYSSICRMMARNQAIDPEIRDDLQRIYGSDTRSLERRLTHWVGKEFSLSLLGFGVKVAREGSGESQGDGIDWIRRVEVLEDLILRYADHSRYFVVFDELDEDYRNIVQRAQYDQYSSLITSLFKAVQDVRSTFRDRARYRINPVIFLRDDIYEIIQDPDKNKWNDFKIELIWDSAKIQTLIAFRVSRALDPNAPQTLSFEAAWSQLVGRQTLGIGARKRKHISSFDFIARSTLLRPRDFVKYLQACAEAALEGNGFINATIIRQVDRAFSNYLKEEFQDEIFSIVPDIAQIFDVISQIGKWNFTAAEFGLALKSQASRNDGVVSRDASLVLTWLFLFSVIGTAPRHNFYTFRYLNRDARINFSQRIIVHRGLFKALQIV